MNSAKLPPIKDIKPIVEIPDYSLYLYWGLIIVMAVILLIAIYWIVKRVLISNSHNREKEYLEALHNIDWHDSKKAAYLATKYGRLLATDDRRKELFEQLLPLLNRYKYKKSVSNVDDETLRRFELYRNVCDESI